MEFYVVVKNKDFCVLECGRKLYLDGVGCIWVELIG